MKKQLLVPILAVTTAGTVLFGVHTLYAQTPETSSLVSRIAQKFGLKESDVQSVFDEYRDERHKEMEARFEDKLTQDVTDGKITESQKQAILSKMKELQEKKQSNIDAWKDMTPEQRRDAMKKERDELKKWADDQGIDLSLIHFGMKVHGMRMMGKMMN